MTTKPSNAPWVDEPLQLIPTPSKKLDGSLAHVQGASEMAQAHNVFIRGLNAIIQQAPYVPVSTDKSYIAQDVKDLLFFTLSWTKMVDHHHWVEETIMFPELDKLTGIEGFMDGPRHEHELFHGGMEKLAEYASTTTPDDYRWDGPGGMKEIVDSFSKPLIDHLYAEIDTLLAMGDVDHNGLMETWKKTQTAAKQSGNLGMMYDAFPIFLGCADKTFEGGTDFPPFPRAMPYAIKYWFASGNGAWRFNPCDYWGQPRPLAFGPSQSR